MVVRSLCVARFLLFPLVFVIGGMGLHGAKPAYNDGDLMIGFRSLAPGFTANNYLINVGPVADYRDASAPITVGTFGDDLKSALAFGSSWYSTFLWGAIAGVYVEDITTGSITDTVGTLYASKAVSSIGGSADPWIRESANAQEAGTANAVSSMGGDFSQLYNATANAPNAAIVPAGAANSWSYWDPGYEKATPFKGLPSSIEAGPGNPSLGGSVLNIFRIEPSSDPDIPSVSIGYFSIDANGTILFTPNAAPNVAYSGPWLWTNASGNWSDSNNWTSGQLATNGVDVGIAGAAGGTITNDTNVTSLASLTFSNGAGAYTLAGTNSSQTLTVTGGITNNSAATQTISLGLNTTSSQTFNAASGNIILGAVSNTAELTMLESAGKAVAVNGAITGSGSLMQSGSGTLSLNASNSYSGGTTLNGGTVVAGNSTAFGTGGISAASNATIAAGSAIALTNTMAVSNGATATIDNRGYAWIQNGAIGGQGAISLGGIGTTTLGASNSYRGGTTLNGGSVVAGNNSAFGTGTIGVSSNSSIVAGTSNLSTTNAVSVVTGQVVTLDTAGKAWTQSGAIGGGGGITKVNLGTLSLSGVNSFTGPTIINGGVLEVTGALAGSGTVTVANGGTLSGTGSVGKTTVQSGGAITAGASGSIGTLSLSTLILNGGGSWNWKMLDATGAVGTGYDALSVSGALDLSALSSGSKFTINLESLSSTNPAVSGNASHFDANASTNWVIASYGSVGGAFSTNLFSINSSGFVNGLNGSFGIGTNASGLILSYTTAFVAGVGGEWNSGSGALSSRPLITNGVSLLFSGSGGSVTNDAVTSLSSITFATNAGAYALSGNEITNGGSGIVNNSTNAQTIGNAISLGSVQSFTAGAGSLTISGNIGLSSNTLTIAGSNNTTLSGVVSGTAGLIKTGTGTLTLSGVDSFTGGVAISQGTLLLSGGDNRLWTNSSVSVASNSVLNLGSNSQQLSQLVGSGTVTGQSTATLTLAPSNASTFAGAIAGAEGVAVNGSGTLTFSGSNSYTGGTTVNGNLIASNASSLGAATNSLAVAGSLNLGSRTLTQGAVTLGGGTISGGTLLSTNVTLRGGTVSANLAGTASVIQSAGTTVLSGSNNFTGGVSLNAGTLISSNISALAGGDVSVNAGTLNLSSVSQSVRSVTLGNGTITGTGVLTNTSFTATNSGAALVSESLAGSGGMIQNGSGTTTISGSNSFTGGVTVTGGTLSASNAFALGSTNGSLNVAGGTLDLARFSQRVGSATLTSGSIGNGTLTAYSGLTVAGNSNSSISATLAGNGGLTKSGSGTLDLATAIPNGAVRIAGGTLQSTASVVGSVTNSTTSVSISNAATWQNSGLLTVGGVSNATATLSIAAGGSLAATNGLTIARDAGSRGTVTLGDSNGAANLSLGSGTVSFGSGNGNLVFNQSGDYAMTNRITSLVAGKGTITGSGSGTTTLTGNNSGFTGSTYLSSGTVVLGADSQLGGMLNIANKNSVFELKSGSSLAGTNSVHAVAGTLNDYSGQAFTNSIRGKVVLAQGGTLNKTYDASSSVAGFGAGIGAGKSFSLLAGSVAESATLTAKVTAGALDFKGTYSNAVVMSITDPGFSTIRNTIQWYDPASKTWKNTVAGNSGNKTAAISGMNGKSFSGSFSTFLLQAGAAGILTTAEDTLAEINAMTAAQINVTLAKIMGAFGYDNKTKTSWAVINHNSLYSGEDLGSSAIFDEAALNHTLSDPGLVSSGQNVTVMTVQAVPEPGSWALMILGVGALLLTARTQRRARG